MPEFRCKDVGAVCNARFSHSDPNELLYQVSLHWVDKHDLIKMTDTIRNYLAGGFR